MKQSDLIFYYQITDGEAVLLRCYGAGFLQLPESVDGFPLTKISAYAFSPARGDRPLPLGALRFPSAMPDMEPAETALETGGAEQVVLPDGVRAIGDYAFFNCRRLQTVFLPASVSHIGNGAFMNCEALREAQVVLGPDGKSALRPLALDFQRELHVTLLDPAGGTLAKLVFPEFCEESLENLPAKVFDYHVQGSGYAYRQCFWGDEFSFAEYDALFQKNRITDSKPTMIKVALARLAYPYQLSDSARELYKLHLAGCGSSAAAMLVEEDDLPGLEFLASLELLTGQDVAEAVETANRAGRTECLSFLLDYRHKRFDLREKSFDL